jgi:hypothetical protein
MRIPCRGALRPILSVVLLVSSACAIAQQTLGGLTGAVVDASGAVLVGAKVQLTGDGNGISLTTTTQRNGVYQFQNLPVGTYTLVFTEPGFDAVRVPSVPVQENRTATINGKLKVGSANTTIVVNETPLLNETDATNGYVLDSAQIQETPLATGSFTRLALLTPGVSAELLGGIGTNAGLGNAPIWANGQRDTSNGFNVDGVDVTNLFNGKSSSQSQSQRYSFNIGQSNTGTVGGQNVTSTSVYGSNGNGLATPPPEFIQELRVNTSQYDSQQGNHSGAQIDVNTATGSNQIHGQAFGNRATNFINAAPYFNKQSYYYQQNPQVSNPSFPLSMLVPQLHRDILGGTFGGPILKNKLFFFLGYENQHVTDALKGYSAVTVPQGLTDDRSQAGILNAINSWNATTTSAAVKGTAVPFNGVYDPVAMALLTAKLSNGQYLIPSVQNAITAPNLGTNVFLQQPSLFQVNEATTALDYNMNSRDRVSAKYYYQHSPDVNPFSNANTGGFPATEDSGAQVGALSNSITIGPRINWEQRFGFSRQKVYTTFKAQLPDSTFGIGFPGASSLPGISLGKFAYSSGGSVTTGPNSTFANEGYFQNRWNPSTNLIFSIGKHNLSAGSSYSYTQLNIRNRRANLGSVSTANFVTFVEGQASSSNELIGNANRYYRANEIGTYLQDQWRVLSNLSITAGIRYDYDGAFTEKYGNMFGFDPSLYSATQTAVVNSGFVVAGNNAYSPTSGVSNSTLTGRQWGIAPRLGFAYTPGKTGGKLVIRGGAGMYYDRGELFSYLSQPAGGSTGGPFGVTQAAPLVNYVTGTGSETLENPLGTAVIPVSSSDPSTFNAKLPTTSQIKASCTGLLVEQTKSNSDCSVTPINFGAYARDNKLPYTISYTFNVQYQLTKDMAATLGYSGNRSRHLVVPVPFNEPGIATPTNPINGETSSYGYEVLNTAVTSGKYYTPISTEPYDTYSGGNIDLRVPYIGYSPNAALYKAAANAAYDSLQAHLEKRMSNYFQVGASYTYSHALDEQSDLGLFFTGDNPNNLRDSWASADFDRTHTVVFNYVIQIPKLASEGSLVGKFTHGWQLVGITTLQSGQPYSLYEYDGAVGSIYFGNYPTLANPVLGIKNGSNPKSALTGHSGSQLNVSSPGSYSYIPAIDPSQLQVNYLQPGQKGIPNCTGSSEPCDVFETDFTPGQRNIFRQSFQKDADLSIQKITRFSERYSARYTFDIYNLTNSVSLDVPNNSASVSQSKLTLPTGGTAVAYGQVATSTATQTTDVTRLYVTPTLGATSFGSVRNAIGQPRTIEMSLHLVF